jgi:membrane protein implicated in regulation of membrane protease activity
MNALRVILPVLGVLLLLTGLVFLIAAPVGNTLSRVVIGLVMVVLGIYLLRTGLRRESSTTRTVVVDRKVELTGDVSLEDLTCRSCGAALSSDSVSVRAGAVFVACPHCGTEYQLEEAPKW